MLRIALQQRKLLIRPAANLPRERAVFLPIICISAVLHPALKRLDSTVLFVVQGSLDRFVETARRKIGLDTSIDGVGVLVKPHAQFLQFLRRERADSAFDFLDRI
jgi:hypothetical protein